MGFGTGPFGLSNFGIPADEPEEFAPVANVSSRSIDKDKRYVVLDTSGFDAMDDTAQRVLLAVSFALADEPPYIDDRYEATLRQRIAEALADLTDVKDPSIDLQEIIVSNDGKSTTFRGVRYKNRRTGTLQSVMPR